MNKLISWTERKFFSIEHDCEVSRLSGFDDNHQEHWQLVATGRGYRERRDESLLEIMEAIESGHAPGEVMEDDYHQGE